MQHGSSIIACSLYPTRPQTLYGSTTRSNWCTLPLATLLIKPLCTVTGCDGMWGVNTDMIKPILFLCFCLSCACFCLSCACCFFLVVFCQISSSCELVVLTFASYHNICTCGLVMEMVASCFISLLLFIMHNASAIYISKFDAVEYVVSCCCHFT